MGQNRTWKEGDGNLSSQKKIPTGNNMNKNLPDLKIQETFQKAKEFRTTQISAVTEAIKLGFESLIPLVEWKIESP